MAEQNMDASAPRSTVQAGAPAPSMWSRLLKGTSFLGLEHTIYIILVVAFAGLTLSGLAVAFAMWMTSGSSYAAITVRPLATMWGVSLAASLLVVAAALMVLSKRVHAELAKRPGFEQRVAYKAPIYAALGVLKLIGISLVSFLIGLLIYSLVAIGSSVDIGGLYLAEFLPGVVALLVLVLVDLYLWRLAQGRSHTKQFVMIAAFIAAALALALIITSAVQLHQKVTTPTLPSTSDTSNPYDYLNGGSSSSGNSSSNGSSSTNSQDLQKYLDNLNY